MFNSIETTTRGLQVKAPVMPRSEPRRGKLLPGTPTNEARNRASLLAGQMANRGMNTHVCYLGNQGEAALNQPYRSDLRLDPQGINVI